ARASPHARCVRHRTGPSCIGRTAAAPTDRRANARRSHRCKAACQSIVSRQLQSEGANATLRRVELPSKRWRGRESRGRILQPGALRAAAQATAQWRMPKNYAMGGRASSASTHDATPHLDRKSWRERLGALRNLPPFLKAVWATSPALALGQALLRLV